MPLYLDPTILEGQQLILHRLGDDDYSVRVLGLAAGRIAVRLSARNRVVWIWTLTGPYLPKHLRPSHGEADTLFQAKATFRTKFDAWLAWAKELQQPVMWMG